MHLNAFNEEEFKDRVHEYGYGFCGTTPEACGEIPGDSRDTHHPPLGHIERIRRAAGNAGVRFLKGVTDARRLYLSTA